MGLGPDGVRGRWDEGQMDLASAHIANDTLGFLRQQIKFVPKKANPHCIASLRPVKDFWVALKKAINDKGWEVMSFPSLK